MATPYVDTTLIECNRLQSTQKEQVEDDEPNAIFTNKVGDTLILKPGDTIQVASAFINQKGCNIPTSLEFKGTYLTTVKLEKTEPTTIVYNKKSDVMGYESFSQYPETNTINDVEVFDNTATLEVSYYKTSNGEQYVFLPRNYIVNDSNLSITNVNSTTNWDVWKKNNYDKDAGHITGYNSGITYYQRTNASFFAFTNYNDYHLVEDVEGATTKNYLRPKNDNSKYTLFTRVYNWTSNNTNDSYKLTHGGTDYTINGNKYFEACNGDAEAIPDPLKRYVLPLSNEDYDPALAYYVQQIDNVDISVKKGFNSAQSVAEQLTEDLQKYIVNESNGTYWANGTNNTGITSSTTTSLLRPRTCANPITFGRSSYVGSTTDGQKGLNLLNSYKHILVKRPDLFTLGRKCNNRFCEVPNVKNTPLTTENTDQTTNPMVKNFVKNTIVFNTTSSTNWTDPIITNWLWEKSTLETLRDLFICQGKYPELFKVDNVAGDVLDRANRVFTNEKREGDETVPNTLNTIKNSRFLHMTRVDYNATHNKQLGYDDYVKKDYTVGTANFDASHMSAPIFFKYDTTRANIFTDGNSTNDLCYGFATKSKIGNNEYITIHPELVGGIASYFYSFRGGNTGDHINGDQDCLIGWDYHFNSYGNVVMMAQTGMLTQTPNCEWSIASGNYTTQYSKTDTTGVDLTEKYSQTYLGSNNCACVYDTVSNKFGWEYMHIPENVGQLYNSGESEVIDSKTATGTRLPLVDDAKNEVYKINKRLQYWSYCPDMVPYLNADDGVIKVGSNALSNGGATFTSSGAVELSLFNINLEPWTVFDAHTGVNLNFGKCCDKLNWDKSLLGIMGHTYQQFNPEEITTTNNGTQARLTFNNLKSIYNPTTNSEVVSADIKDYVITPYGATQYYPQPAFNTSIREFDTKAKADTKHTFMNYYPAIAQATQSIILEAVNLPKTILNPYLNIRSDIISDSKYFGGFNSGLNYPIVAVINKINADKDYIQLDGSDITFTVKKQMAISDITTVITDPDGSLALVDEGSSVIYKVSRAKSGTDLNILQQIIEQDQKKK